MPSRVTTHDDLGMLAQSRINGTRMGHETSVVHTMAHHGVLREHGAEDHGRTNV